MDYRSLTGANLRTPEERRLAAAMAQSVMGKAPEPAWQPEYEKEPGLEAPMVSPDDLLGSGIPTKAAMMGKALLAKAAAMAPMAAGAGIIRQGGMGDLVAIHQTSPRKLWPWVSNDKLPRELLAPSLAINRGGITQDFGDTTGTVTLVARPDALDPKNVGGGVWPRDVYTPRIDQFRGQSAEDAVKSAREGEIWGDGTKRDLLRTEAQRRNEDRFSRQDLVLQEGAAANSPAHELTVRLAPKFGSYEAFERSPQGAGVLAENMHPQDLDNLQAAWQTDLWKQLQSHFPYDVPANLGNGAQQFRQKMESMIRAGALTRPQEQAYYEFLRNYKNIPSGYAEQKITAPIGMHGGNFAGAIIRENPELQRAAADAGSSIWGGDVRKAAMYTAPDSINRLLRAFASRGIPAVTSRDPMEEYELARWLSVQPR